MTESMTVHSPSPAGQAIVGEAAIEGPASLARPAIAAASQLTRADAAAVHWWDSETSELRSYTGQADGSKLSLGLCPTQGFSDNVYHNGRRLVINDYQNWRSELPTGLRDGIQVAAAVPIAAEGKTLGVLTVYRQGPAGFVSEDLDRLTLVAGLIAPSLEKSLTDTVRQEREELLDMILTNAPLVCGVLNREGIVTIGGGAGLAAIGIQASYFIGASVFDLYRRNPEFLSAVGRALAGKRGRLEMKSNLSGHTWEVCLDPLHDDQGQVKGASMILIDLTERNQAREAKRDAETKARFLTAVSGEFREPLTAIMNAANELQVASLSEADRQRVADISAEARKLMGVITEIPKAQSDLSEPVELRTLVRDTLDAAGAAAESSGVTLSSRVSSVLKLEVDPILMRQALSTVVTNALRLPPGSSEVKIAASEALGWIEIRVGDLGGTAEEQTALFEQGLELTAIRKVLEMMGGQLTLEGARPTEGAAFAIRLPAASI